MPRRGETSHDFLTNLVGKDVSVKQMGIPPIVCSLISFDEFTVICRVGNTAATLIFKHAIESICEA